jgi:hypothetical protein
MAEMRIVMVTADGQRRLAAKIPEYIQAFRDALEPLETECLYLLTDARTGAKYCECHLRASKIVELGTIDVPLDPEEQPDYRANREIVEGHVGYERMKQDALQRRSFSNIVAEFNTIFDPQRPLKIIGGQHRFNAIDLALQKQIDELHGVKVYFGLKLPQRLDVQLISNTNIDTSLDLVDRIQETARGPHLRDWCQHVGLLEANQDFADKRQRGEPLTVRAARTFILNYYRGKQTSRAKFDQTDTTPLVCKTGVPDPEWQRMATRKRPPIWDDPGLERAGREFALLAKAQRASVASRERSDRGKIDFAEKALNFAVLSGWAYVAGLLQNNDIRLKRHYGLREQSKTDPLNAAALAKGRHKTDSENYRGLGYRTDAKERGRLVELFCLQAENGEGICKKVVEVAIAKYHAKQAQMEVLRAQERG